VSERTANSIIY